MNDRNKLCGANSGYTQGCRCQECRKAHAHYQKAYRKKRPDVVKRMNLRQYGLSLEEWQRRVVACDNKCEVCRQEEVGKNQHGRMALATDHDHKTGKVRGLLCHRCNRALGLLGDSSDRLEKLLEYRRRFDEQ